MEAVTVGEAFKRMEPAPLGNIFPGSWINANFDVWIGAEEDNRSWRLLLNARKAYEATHASVPEEKQKLALEEILIAEGSDWNWWYGPEHESANAVEFDQIYREHLANASITRLASRPRPNSPCPSLHQIQAEDRVTPPRGPISAVVNGVIDSYFEWLGSGIYRVDQRSGSMHGKRTLIKELRYGADESNIFLRFDLDKEATAAKGLAILAELAGVNGDTPRQLNIAFEGGAARVQSGQGSAAFRDVMEISFPAGAGTPRIRLSFWQDGLPIQAIPPQDFLPVAPPQPWSG